MVESLFFNLKSKLKIALTILLFASVYCYGITSFKSGSLDNKNFINYLHIKNKNILVPNKLLYIENGKAVILTQNNKLYLINTNNFDILLSIGNPKNSQAPGGFSYIVTMFKSENILYVSDIMRNLSSFSVKDKFKFLKRINTKKISEGFPYAIDSKHNIYCCLYYNKTNMIQKINLANKLSMFFGKRDNLNGKTDFMHYNQVYCQLIDDKLYCLQSHYPTIEEYDSSGFLIKKYLTVSTNYKQRNLAIKVEEKNFTKKISSSGYSTEWVCKLQNSTIICSISYKLNNTGNHVSLIHFYDSAGQLIGYIEKNLKYLGSDNKTKLFFYDEEKEDYVIGFLY